MKENLEELMEELATMVDSHQALTNSLKEKHEEFISLFEEFAEIDDISAQEVFDEHSPLFEYLEQVEYIV